MKKTLVLFLIIFGIVNIPVSAETFEFDLNEETNLYQQMYEDYKVDELSGNLNNEVEDLFSKLEINPENPFSFSNLFSKDGLKHFKNYNCINRFYGTVKNHTNRQHNNCNDRQKTNHIHRVIYLHIILI